MNNKQNPQTDTQVQIESLTEQLNNQKKNIEELVSLLVSGQQLDPSSILAKRIIGMKDDVVDVDYKDVPEHKVEHKVELDKEVINSERKEPTFDMPNNISSSTNNTDNELHIAPDSSKKLSDKTHKFKNMIASSFVKFTDQYGFTKEGKADWYDLSRKTGVFLVVKKEQAQRYYNSIKDIFKQVANTSGVAFNTASQAVSTIKDTTQSVYETITLVGNKRKVNMLQKKFSSVLDVLGFEASELFQDTHKNSYLSNAEVEKKLNAQMENLRFTKDNGKYVNGFLENIPDETKASIIYSVIWPSLAEKINEGMKLTSEISAFQKSNKYLKIITQFAANNNMSSEDVTNILMKDKQIDSRHIFSNKKGINKIQENIEQIIENVEKFTALANNNVLFINTFIKATEDIKEVIVSSDINAKKKLDLLKAIDDSIVYTPDRQQQGYKYSTIRKNMGDIIINENKESGIKADINVESTPKVSPNLSKEKVLETKTSIQNDNKQEISNGSHGMSL